MWKKSLWHNVKEHKYECLNLRCKAVGSSPDEIAKTSEYAAAHKKYVDLDRVIRDSNNIDSGLDDNSKQRSSYREEGRENNVSKKIANLKIQNWLKVLLFVFALSMAGLGVSKVVGSFIPFWLLFVFSSLFSVEKWFGYIIRKRKALGRPYRLLLNLCILSLLGLIIWSGIKLFSQQFIHSALADS